VANTDDRLHLKTRVLGIQTSQLNKVFVIEDFPTGVNVIQEEANGFEYVVVGSSDLDLAIAFRSRLSDGTLLAFTPVQDNLPIVMQDNEGNQWNIFGEAVAGPRSGEQLDLASHFTAFWFAWVAFYPTPEIHAF
ncbi:MAG: DUF3179 domain-containing protein, partial [Kangiellaceae bacterium]|nr:DUF3179 domain-containing protein [Kangiellaceae bacterium]